MRRNIVLAVILLMILVSPVLAVSYVDLERTTVGSLFPNYALDYDGSNDSVQVSDSSSLHFSTEMTVEVWISPTRDYGSEPTGWRMWVNRDAQFYLGYEGWNDGIAWTVYDSVGAKHDTLFVTTLNEDDWHHIVGLVNSTALQLWVNGDLKDDIAITGIRDLETTITIGKEVAGAGYWEGIIDESRIYSRGINSTEISYSYNSGDGTHTPLSQSGLVAWWKFDEGVGATTYDETTNDNDGTLIGLPDWVDGKSSLAYYPANIVATELESSYDIRLYNSTSGLVCNATADSEGTANMTLPSSYRYSSFEGTFRVYDESSDFVYSKWFEDVRGGDQYEAIQETRGVGLELILLILPAVIIVFIALIARRN